MSAISLTTLRARVREAADAVNSSFVSDTATSVDAFINQSLRRLYGKIVGAHEDYYLTSTAFQTVAGQDLYSLPATLLKLKGIDLQIDGVRYKALKPMTFGQRNAYRNAPTILLPNAYDTRYLLFGTPPQVELWPAPNAVMNGLWWYVPQFVDLDSNNPGTSTFEDPNGWAEWAVLDAARKILRKEESDTTEIASAASELWEQITRECANRDAGAPQTITDVYHDDEGYP